MPDPADESAVPSRPVDDLETQPHAPPRRILVVDDVPANLVAMEAALAPLGRSIATASSGRAGLARLLEEDFALLLLDVQMPGMDGFETAQLIRSTRRTRLLPIIFVTAHHMDADGIRRAYKLGAVDFLFKPIDADILLAKAAVFVTLQYQADALAAERLHREFEAARREYERHAMGVQLEREHEAKEELARANAALAEADRRKDAFLAILSHELRNPLAPMRTAIDLARCDPSAETRVRTIDVLDRQVTQLTRLVDDLLDVARIKANKVALQRELVDLRTIVEGAVATCAPAIAQRRHALAVVLPPVPVPIHGDPARLTQVVTNLLTNAARYTPPAGAIEIVCDVVDGNGRLRVRDNGIGIAPDVLDNVFDMFVQERADTDGNGGLGLGLALTRQLVELHDGRVAASSAGRGHGSTFTVTLPMSVAIETVEVPHSGDMVALAPPARRALHLKAIVVDDNLDTCELTAALLSKHGHEVLTANDARSALSLIREHRPDVALVDIGLPDIDGVGLARLVREQCPTLATRLIAISGHGTPDDIQRSRDAGYVDYLVKPVSSAVILSAVEQR
jgi:signal transduction histidine kinase